MTERTRNVREPVRAADNARPVRPGRSDLLDGIDLLVFDKDGTLIEFHAMWGAWVGDLADRLEAATGRRLRTGLYQLLGVEPATGLVHAHGLLAATPMSRIREHVQAFVIEHDVSRGQAAGAIAAAWHAPDPVGLAQPVTDLPALLARLRPIVGAFAVATSDDRDPTERTLTALGIEGEMSAIVCADDGIPNKPAPHPVLHLCRVLGIPPARTAVVGDSPADLRMSRAARAGRTIGVLTGVAERHELEPLADAVLASIADLAPATLV
ncbi:MAG TPA: HAD family hydrolase [Candidatus Dormibacteraeota bacterium]|nr:HAD family hydrolase [Candidatus Dormibacteraeota bacterium]